jgi:coenzyme PQQ precursor peptide PqqA
LSPQRPRQSIDPGAGNGVLCFKPTRSFAMAWEKPAAINWRFGMEITLYVANR